MQPESHRKVTSIKYPSDLVPSEIAKSVISLSKPQGMASAFNPYFVNVGSGIKFLTKYSGKRFFITILLLLNSFFISVIDKDKINI